MEYYSQHGQDKYMDEQIFKGKVGGTFVEIGAHNGEAFSNTCFLERFRNWNGICVEPLPHCFEQMKTKRNCTRLNVCISDVEGEEEFVVLTGWTEMLSGLLNSYDPSHLRRIDRELIDYGGTKTIKKVATVRLDRVLTEHNITKIDYVSIDTEGSEMQILRSIDFSKVDIHCLSIENNYKTNSVELFMASKGYYKHTTLVCDEIYLKRT